MSENTTGLNAHDRRNALVRLVEDQGYCTTTELSRHFAVSEMTVRRDVGKLVEEGRLRSFHGGVSALSPQEFLGSDYGARAATAGDVKWRIAERALQEIRAGSVVALDAGSTVAALASQLSEGFRVRVVTASLPAITALASNPSIEVTSLGGVLHSESQSFAGPTTLAAIGNLHVDTLFLGASAVGDRGAFCANDFDSVTKRSLIDAADRVVLLADSSKFGHTAMAKICDWAAISSIIVDDALDDHSRSILEHHGIETLLVPSLVPR